MENPKFRFYMQKGNGRQIRWGDNWIVSDHEIPHRHYPFRFKKDALKFIEDEIKRLLPLYEQHLKNQNEGGQDAA